MWSFYSQLPLFLPGFWLHSHIPDSPKCHGIQLFKKQTILGEYSYKISFNEPNGKDVSSSSTDERLKWKDKDVHNADWLKANLKNSNATLTFNPALIYHLITKCPFPESLKSGSKTIVVFSITERWGFGRVVYIESQVFTAEKKQKKNLTNIHRNFSTPAA